MTPIYLDHHATTPVAPEALDAMEHALRVAFGNPSARGSRHGREAATLVERARGDVAALIGASARQITFTSGATESDNLAILGFLRGLGRPGHLVTQSTEHSAVLRTAEAAEAEGHRVTRLGVDGEGRVDLEALGGALEDGADLVSIMLVNAENGALQPVDAVCRRAREASVRVHIDAAQGVGLVPFDVAALGPDLVSLSAHKLYGPKGVGALYRRSSAVRLAPLLHGGGQEGGLRAGTLNVPGIAGFGAAARVMRERGERDARHLATLADSLAAALLAAIPHARLLGPARAERHPGNLLLHIAAVPGAKLVTDLAGTLTFSTGSACATDDPRPSHVLLAMGVDAEEAREVIRLGLGRDTTADDVERATRFLAEAVRTARAGSALYARIARGEPRDDGW